METNAAAHEITTAQIKALRAEAEANGDTYQVDICDVALAKREHDNEDGSPLVGPEGMPMSRTEARAQCARAVAAGQG